jgi:hypothetical protein
MSFVLRFTQPTGGATWHNRGTIIIVLMLVSDLKKNCTIVIRTNKHVLQIEEIVPQHYGKKVRTRKMAACLPSWRPVKWISKLIVEHFFSIVYRFM